MKELMSAMMAGKIVEVQEKVETKLRGEMEEMREKMEKGEVIREAPW